MLPAAELYILLKIGSIAGFTNTMIIIVTTGIIGSILYQSQSRINLTRIKENLDKGILPDKEIVNRLMIMFGAVFLITPGIITDVIGFILLIPWTRKFAKKKIKNWMMRKVGESRMERTTVEVRTF